MARADGETAVRSRNPSRETAERDVSIKPSFPRRAEREEASCHRIMCGRDGSAGGHEYPDLLRFRFAEHGML